MGSSPLVQREWRRLNQDKVKENRKRYYSINKERIKEKSRLYHLENKDKIAIREKRYRELNLDKIRTRERNYKVNSPERFLYYSARARAKKYGLAFNLTIEDIKIPETCPVLGIKLLKAKYKYENGSPTLDRIDPKQGYIKGNILVISFRANKLKSDASIDELIQISNFYSNYRDTTHQAEFREIADAT